METGTKVSQKITVHVLSCNQPLCRFTAELPEQWPGDHQHVNLRNWGQATCPECLKFLGREEETDGA